MRKVTRKNCERFTYFEHITLKNEDGTRLCANRSGKTKLWKRQPERFQIPCKYSTHKSICISDRNHYEWEGK